MGTMDGRTVVIGGDHDVTDPTRPVQEQARKSDGVRIGAGAWLGAGVKVLDGVTIGDGSVVGARSVVAEDVPLFLSLIDDLFPGEGRGCRDFVGGRGVIWPDLI